MKLVCLVLCSLLVCDFAYSAAGDNYICDIVKWPAVFANKVRDNRDRDSTAIKNLKFGMQWKTDGKVVLTEITEFQDETTIHGIPVEYEVENTYWAPGFWSGSAWHTGIQQIHFDETIGRLIKVDGLYSPKHPNFMVTVLHMKCYTNQLLDLSLCVKFQSKQSNPAYDAGWIANRNLESIETNPYQPSTEHGEWLNGWHAAQGTDVPRAPSWLAKVMGRLLLWFLYLLGFVAVASYPMALIKWFTVDHFAFWTGFTDGTEQCFQSA